MAVGRFQKFVFAAAQTVLVQGLGMIFFYLNSLYLPKAAFGLLNTYIAAGAIISNVLSLGFEQVAFRRMAAGQVRKTFGVFLLHTLVTAGGAALLLYMGSFAAGERLQYLCWFYGGQAFFYVAGPFRTFLNAQQRYTPYAVITLVTNLLRIAGLIALHYSGLTTLYSIALLLTSTMALEALLLAVVVLRSRNRPPVLYRPALHRALFVESRPQYGALLLETALSRADWILMSFLTTAVITAEYSFAYRAFEVARMPTIVMTTLLLPQLSRWVATSRKFSAAQTTTLQEISIFSFFAGGLLVLLGTGLWSPLLDMLTRGKYGTANFWPFAILALSLPLHFLINMYWIVAFAHVEYSVTTKATFWAALVNLGANFLLIPLAGSNGAALAFLLATGVQLFVYLQALKEKARILPPPAALAKMAATLLMSLGALVLLPAGLPLWLKLPLIVILYTFTILQSQGALRHTLIRKWKDFRG